MSRTRISIINQINFSLFFIIFIFFRKRDVTSSNIFFKLPKSVKLYKFIKLYNQPQASVKHYCISCMSFYEEKKLRKTILHKLHFNVDFIFCDIKKVLELKLLKPKFCACLLKGITQFWLIWYGERVIYWSDCILKETKLWNYSFTAFKQFKKFIFISPEFYHYWWENS